MSRKLLLLLLLGCLVFDPACAAPSIRRFRPLEGSDNVRRTVRKDLLDKCQERWRNSTLDHFTFGQSIPGVPETFRQRYFFCDTYWKPDGEGRPGPIFFYFGNEANVELYLNNTGLMWESAPDFNALLVFAEHRYYGDSKPFANKVIKSHMQYLTTEQAMADFAGLIGELKQLPGAEESAIIGFGGSYGGMIGSWFRMKYPHLVDGVIAGSAPIWSFLGEVPAVDTGFFAKGTTFDASPAGGSSASCVDNVRLGWKALKALGASKEGRQTLHDGLGLCHDAKLDDGDDVIQLRDWLASAWDTMAMGNFPYPSGYILNGVGQLPAYPVRKACQFLKVPGLEGQALLTGLAAAAGVFYNHTGALPCFDHTAGVNPETSEVNDFWGWQYCTEMFQLFSRDGVTDMFWEDPWNASAVSAACQEQWGVTPRQLWATQEWGGRRIETHSNIVFSNGLLDPWHGGGILRDVSPTLVALIIPEGAHHLDLMFSNPEDPESVIEVRRLEREWMQRWIDEVESGHSLAARVAGAASGLGRQAGSLTQAHSITAPGLGSRSGADAVELGRPASRVQRAWSWLLGLGRSASSDAEEGVQLRSSDAEEGVKLRRSPF